MKYALAGTGSRLPRLLIALAMAVGPVCGLTANSLQQPIGGSGGASKDFKLRGPMGVIQLSRPPVKAPKAIRALLPRNAKVRLLQPLTLNPEDTLVVYDTPERGEPNDLIDSRDPAVLVLRQNHVVGRFSLKGPADDDLGSVFLEAGEIHLSAERAGVALAFRFLGDGSSSLFLIISPEGEKYRTVLRKSIDQGRLRADQDGNLELWEAGDGGECIWCPHQYTIFAYRWDGAHFSRVRKATSCRELDPDAMTDEPIELLNRPLDSEYADAQHGRRQHRGVCDSRDPIRKKHVRP